jgi:pimeloyl-ACP methyl ester carboxylesterase
MHEMLIPPCLVFVAALTTCLASLWAQGQTPGPASSEPSWVRGGAYRLKTRVFRGAPIGAEPVLVVGRPDKVTPPDLSESYQAVAATFGKNVRLVQLEGKGHEIFLEPAVFAALAPMLK